MLFDKEKFEALKTEYYQLRGWDKVTGLQRIETLKKLEMPEIAKQLEKQGLVKD